MAEALILDSEALSALAHASRRPSDALRARAILRVASEENAVVRVPSPVLAEVCRGGARDAAVNRVLAKGMEVVNLDVRIAKKAGALLHKKHLDSSHAVDAFVVATAAAIGDCVIATQDPDDLNALAATESGVRVWAI